MADPQDQEIEARFIKLALSSTLKTMASLQPDVDVPETVRQHMLTICAGVRERAMETSGDAAHVDALIATINEYFDYAASPMFPPVEIVRRSD